MTVDILQPISDTTTSPAAASKSDDFTNGMNKAPRDVAWYQTSLTRVPETAQQVLTEYSGIPENELSDHIQKIREKAWEILPYPCIGLFRFLDFPAYLSPKYPEVLHRVRAGETFLDLGCCFGQDIRRLAYDGAPSENLVGVDTEPRFIELGYELFGDREKLKAHFCTQDVFDEDFLAEWRGKIDIVFLGSFLHLFSFEQQKIIVGQLDKLLRKCGNALVFGRHLGTEKGGLLRENACGWSLYHHSPNTMRQLWDTASEGDWDMSAELVKYQSEGWNNGVNWQGGDEIKQLVFSATRL